MFATTTNRAPPTKLGFLALLKKAARDSYRQTEKCWRGRIRF